MVVWCVSIWKSKQDNQFTTVLFDVIYVLVYPTAADSNKMIVKQSFILTQNGLLLNFLPPESLFKNNDISFSNRKWFTITNNIPINVVWKCHQRLYFSISQNKVSTIQYHQTVGIQSHLCHYWRLQISWSYSIFRVQMKIWHLKLTRWVEIICNIPNKMTWGGSSCTTVQMSYLHAGNWQIFPLKNDTFMLIKNEKKMCMCTTAHATLGKAQVEICIHNLI